MGQSIFFFATGKTHDGDLVMDSHRNNPEPRTVRSVARAVLIGVGGSLILFFFLLTFLHVWNAARVVPWILAFNAASTGYLLIEKTDGQLPRKRLTAAIAGGLTALLGCAAIALGVRFLLGIWLFSAAEIGFFALVGIGCSELGMAVAVKYREIKKEMNP